MITLFDTEEMENKPLNTLYEAIDRYFPVYETVKKIFGENADLWLMTRNELFDDRVPSQMIFDNQMAELQEFLNRETGRIESEASDE